MALVKNGRVALHCFAVGCAMYISTLFFSAMDLSDYLVHYVMFYAALANILVYVIYRDHYDVAIRALSLGLAFSLSLFLSMSSMSGRLLGWYFCALCLFHWGEYFVTAVSNPRNLSLESFLLDHSKEYHAAIAISVIEFIIEWWVLSPVFKQPNWVSVVGLCVVFGGDLLRKLAMLTAKSNFNHYVQHKKQRDHELVTDGIYAFTRHPSYVGWFYWSIGNQVMMCNPLCVAGFAYVSWRFFQDRIVTEEITLINFFGEDYLAYQKRVGTGIPFLKGYRIEV